VLTKDLLRVSRRGGGYQPQFADGRHESLAASIIGCYQGHVGKRREHLQEALTDIERESEDFKLVRGFAKLLDREATWEVQSPLDPNRAREAAFSAGEAVGVVTTDQRREALEQASDTLDTVSDAIEQSLYADLESRAVLTAVDSRWSPDELVTQYNLSLAQTALFDATEIRIQSSDPKTVISAVKRLRLLYEIRRLPDEDRRAVGRNDREIVVTGPDGLFQKTRRYGTRFARLLRTVAKTSDWRLEATIDDRGTERELVLTDSDVSVPGVEPVTEVSYDSEVEAEFARRFESLDFDWTLVREPDAIAAGEHVVIPDFAFDYEYSEFRVYFEIMGFWTPEYVEKKLSRLAAIDEVELLVAVDESLGVGEEITARDHRAIPYTGSVRIKDVRNALRRYEQQLTDQAADSLPDELRLDEDVISVAALSEQYGVTSDAFDDVDFPAHERIGGVLVAPEVLDRIDEELETGMALSDVESVLESYDITETSAVLGELGYRIEWEGLSGGTLREKA
jgi:predicted nuclease of restriction endonuclease-like RecB superfamily